MQLTSGPSASVRLDGTVDVFAKGPDNQIYHRYLYAGRWTEWGTIGGIAASAPASASRNGTGKLDVVVKGGDNRFYHKSWDPTTGWADWGTLGGQFLYAPAIVSHDYGKIDVFGIGTDHALYQNNWNGSAWSGWIALGGYFTSAPAAVSRQAGQVDVYARDANNNLGQASWNGASWSWGTLSTIATSGPGAFSEGPGRIDVFVRGGALLYQNQFGSGRWSGWVNQGATTGPVGVPQEPAPVLEDGETYKESSSSYIYFANRGVLHWFTSAEVMQDFGFDPDDVNTLPDGALLQVPRGAFFTMDGVPGVIGPYDEYELPASREADPDNDPAGYTLNTMNGVTPAPPATGSGPAPTCWADSDNQLGKPLGGLGTHFRVKRGRIGYDSGGRPYVRYSFHYQVRLPHRAHVRYTEITVRYTNSRGQFARPPAYSTSRSHANRSDFKPWYAHTTAKTKPGTPVIWAARFEFNEPGIPIIDPITLRPADWMGQFYDGRCTSQLGL